MSDKYNVKIVGLYGKMLGWANYAITLGQTTYFSCDKSLVSDGWHRHEDKHKEQYAKEGVVKFLVKYLWYSIRYGYFKNPYEIEATQAENG